MLSFINNIKRILDFIDFGEVAICTFLILVTIILGVLKYIIINKKPIIDAVALVVVVVISALVISQSTRLFTKLLVTALVILLAAYAVYDFIVSAKIYVLRKSKVQDYLKNSEFEYYLQLNRRNKVIDFSANILTLTNRNKEGMIHLKFPEFLFDCLNIEAVNGEKYTLNTLPEFRSQVNSATSKLKNYEFSFSARNDDNEIVNYQGIIQPIYFGNRYIGKNIYISVNRMEILEKTRNSLAECASNLIDARNQLYVLMSLTSGVVMYFDFQTKNYIATESFRKYTDTAQEEYDFDDFLRMLHPEDVQFYIDQTATINSLNTTRLKFRMIIGNKYYSMIEDSIYLAKEDKLVSIIRVAQDMRREETPEVILSTKEATEILDDLGASNIDQMADSTLDLLNRLSKKND